LKGVDTTTLLALNLKYQLTKSRIRIGKAVPEGLKIRCEQKH